MALAAHFLARICNEVKCMLAIQDTVLPALWNQTVELCHSQVVCSQPFFVELCGRQCAFLPEPSNRLDVRFWQQCATFGLPLVEMQALKDMAPLMDKQEELAVEVRAFSIEEIKVKVAVILHAAFDIAASSPPPEALGRDLLEMSRNFVRVADDFAKLQGDLSEEKAKLIEKYFLEHVGPTFLRGCQPLMDSVASAAAAIPASYASCIESRNAAQCKSIMFNKGTHERVASNMDIFNSFSQELAAVVKTAGQWLSLARIKSFEAQMRELRVYTTSVHGLNILFHKMNTKNAMGKTAMVREYFGQISFYRRFYLFIVGGLGDVWAMLLDERVHYLELL
eukprot:Skav223977  [mRNA]  locus=scaffold1107:286302:287312:- [translate_table: standard]